MKREGEYFILPEYIKLPTVDDSEIYAKRVTMDWEGWAFSDFKDPVEKNGDRLVEVVLSDDTAVIKRLKKVISEDEIEKIILDGW